MPRALACIIFVTSLAGGMFAQSAGSTAAFEAGDVRVSPKAPNAYMTSFFRGGRYEVRKGTMLDLIRVAYGVDSYKVLGGPGWLETDRFDVTARAPVDTTPEALKEMLKALLVDRFKLVVRNDNKPIPTFFLTAGK
jgi:uncharacterized protein (TIGR03435 family)